MDKVNQLNVKKDMKVSELIDQFDKSGVLGSGRVARASNILVDMIKDEEMNVFINTAKLRLTIHHPSKIHRSGYRYYGYPLQTWQMYHRYCG